jgi:hypothetical protein
MKSLASLALALLLSIPALADLRVGTYKLEGSIPGGNSYSGTVTIEALGPNYKLTWAIGDQGQQQQSGHGILEGDVLSVAYMDATGADWGVVSFKKMSDTKFEGKWSSFQTEMQGTEVLEFSRR